MLLAIQGDDLLQESALVPWDEFGTMKERKKENEKMSLLGMREVCMTMIMLIDQVIAIEVVMQHQ